MALYTIMYGQPQNKCQHNTQKPYTGITQVKAQDIAQNSTNISWMMNDFGTGQVEYGETLNYGLFNIKEKRFKFKKHMQPLVHLKPNTIYHYRIISEDKNGTLTKSKDYIFKTLKNSNNMVINQNLNQWTISGSIEYDLTQSYDNKPGAIKFFDTTKSYIISKVTFPVKAGEIYTLTAQIKTDVTPSSILDIHGAIKGGNIHGSQNLFGSYVSNSKKNLWEEVKISIKIPDNTKANQLFIKIIKPDFLRQPRKLNNGIKNIEGTIWIDNIRLKKGVFLGKRPSKKSFKSSQVSIDTLGNIKLNNKPFFPIIAFSDGARGDMNFYKRQGFNTIGWGHSASTFQEAKDAGMMVNFEVTNYISFHGDPPKYTQEQLAIDLQTIKNNNLMDTMLFYYWDNEFYTYDKEIDEVTNIINNIDVLNGIQRHPHYMLIGHYSHTRIYDKFINLSATYEARGITSTSPVTYNGEAIVYNRLIQDFTENQHTPSAIGHFNVGFGKKFRALVLGGISQGMKGIACWRDSATGEKFTGLELDFTKRAWWDDLHGISIEIQHMLDAGLIQASHLSRFQIMTNKPIDKIISGTRLLKDIGYIIVGNVTNKDMSVTFTLKNLKYIPSQIIDFFNNSEINGTISDSSITLTIPAYGSKVLKLNP